MANCPKKIVIIGDSLGMERTGKLGDVPSQVTWPILLQQFLPKKINTDVEIGSLCTRARTMDTVPEAIAEATRFEAETIIIQVGLVDCFPRVTTLEDKKHIDELRPELRDFVWNLMNEHRHTILTTTKRASYTDLDTFTENGLQSARLAEQHGIHVIFLSIIAHADLEPGTPGTVENVELYNKALQDICAKCGNAEYFDLSNFSQNKELLHDDLYHLSPEGNTNLALLLRNHLAQAAHVPSAAQEKGQFLHSFFHAKNNFLQVLSSVLAAAGQTEKAASFAHSAVNSQVPCSIRKTQDIPTKAFIEITNHCNLNCTMCNTHMSKRKKGYMPPEMFERVVVRLQSLGVNKASLHTVGETSIHPQICDLLAIAQKRNFTVFFSTNGQLVPRVKKVLPYYSNTFNLIRFSIDAGTPETYAAIRRGGTIDKVWESLQAIVDFNAANSTDMGIWTNYIVSETNKDEIDVFMKQASKYTTTERMRFHLPNSLSPDPTFLKEIIPFHNLIFPTPNVCTMPFDTIAITFDGKISLCCRDYDGDLEIGSFLEENPLAVWRNRRAETIRKGLLGTAEPSKLCSECHTVAGSEICDTFISNANSLGLDDIGNRLWSTLEALNGETENLSAVRKACKNALA
ncbi:radical SAM protein [Maridesulfovibrio frigidus]|uniref:radical SAM protein n=1 Tax=Maridesulfovibrio frigidus TaxID=340956 RepID=UPI0004E1E283|nr:radical SAM protein [Maridesulfovibrio frigidus]